MDVQDLIRLLFRSLGDADRPYRANPHDIAEVFERIARSSRMYDPLSLSDLEHGLSKLPADRLLPDLKPATTRILKVLLAADEPIGRSKIIERAEISGSRYYERIKTLATLEIVQDREIEGRKRWSATLTPWWITGEDRPESSSSELPDGLVLEQDLVGELVFELGLDVDQDYLTWPYNLDAAYRESRELERWRAFIKGAVVDWSQISETPRDGCAVIGTHPAVSDSVQAELNRGPTPDALSTSSPKNWESPDSVV